MCIEVKNKSRVLTARKPQTVWKVMRKRKDLDGKPYEPLATNYWEKYRIGDTIHTTASVVDGMGVNCFKSWALAEYYKMTAYEVVIRCTIPVGAKYVFGKVGYNGSMLGAMSVEKVVLEEEMPQGR